MKTGPISPSDIPAAKAEHIPEDVFEIVNGLLAANFTAGRALFYQDDILAALEAKGHDRQDVFDKGYLNFEEAYRAQGWKVEYDKPAYNESYRAHFIFKSH